MSSGAGIICERFQFRFVYVFIWRCAVKSEINMNKSVGEGCVDAISNTGPD